MIAADSSVVVAGLLTWHEAHAVSRVALKSAVIPAHALLETYSVLTRLPRPLTPTDAARVLALAFQRESVLASNVDLQTSLATRCARLDISGGAVYDALIAWTALDHGAELITRDRRAMRTYEKVGVRVRILEA
ncbi:MAG: PIN domain-containing protein [Acidimicrobiia bacterium]|nr:PIN domain-containing protein [Acidimicrobiia bacterium]MDH4309446.1 PIN domain-containing protein [Acidimicrobiia bacterium]